MDEFRGEAAQIDRLRTALCDLYAENYKSGQLEIMAQEEATRLGTGCMSRTDIDKFRKGEVRQPRNIRSLQSLWNVVFSGRYPLPTAQADSALHELHGPHGFFHASLKFFDVHQHSRDRAKIDLLGRFAFYHFSEYFHGFTTVQRAVVVGQWDIHLSDGAHCVKEKQEYDGELGRQKMHDRYTGYCLQKGPNVCLLMKETARATPKFYVLDAVYHNPKKFFLTEVLAGHMLKASSRHKFYHSPVYAVRVPENRDVQCNILRPADIPAPVLEELEVLSNR